mgnify:CR=1 FL=1
MDKTKRTKDDDGTDSFLRVYLGLLACLIGFLIPLITKYELEFSSNLEFAQYLFPMALGTHILSRYTTKENKNTYEFNDSKSNFKHIAFYYIYAIYMSIFVAFIAMALSSVINN